MKKFLIFAVILGLLVPAAAFAKAEFSLGGFVKLDSFWDSTQQGKNLNGPVGRNNGVGAGAYQHGQLRFTAQGSRFNFTIKGPKVFGAQTTGFIEMDFDGVNGVSNSASQVYTPRLRHAMFRFNWPTTELLFGQYWSFFCSWYAEAAEDGPFQMTGTPTARIPQIRLTQKFARDWAVMALVGNANNVVGPVADPYGSGGNCNNGTAAETPQIQASLKYNHDFWGKAAYYGKPIPFTAQITGGWQRNVVRGAAYAGSSITAPGVAVANLINTQYINPWLAMGTLFIPVIPTHSANLAGTASLLAQFWIGEGVGAFGFTGDSAAALHLQNMFNWEMQPLKRWGGLAEAQYYFNNQWFLNVAYGISKVFGLKQGFNPGADFLTAAGAAVANNQFGTHQQIDATLWFRPVQAIKFGLQYSFAQTTWLTALSPNINTVTNTKTGDEHRVEFVGYFYF
jgi:hypothetical protein